MLKFKTGSHHLLVIVCDKTCLPSTRMTTPICAYRQYIQEFLYIKIKITVDLGGKFQDQLAERLNYTINELHRQCRISAQGEIKRFVGDNDRQSIWKDIRNLTEKRMSPEIIDDN
jgi:hypothetical protein